ncbi:MAG: DNA oxidative demethylase AlkB [Steroidobacteraceae bacterium]|nr:DNA oxidative demethylase AlkB [Steroidobacteraceae bacterium]MDW8260722.1 DNA oxidative demethylase AlkB [Gammaproteobacteria bacterium]
MSNAEYARIGDPRSIDDGVVLLRRFALADATKVLAAVAGVVARAPWRQMSTPGGRRMSVAISNCGACGWVSDRCGYRYSDIDPLTSRPWPALPRVIDSLARAAAAAAGFANFAPDACLINRYEPGARMGLHQDRDERDWSQPIVSLSFGLPATFVLGGLQRRGTPTRIVLQHGDALVFGGAARLRFHGVLPLAPGQHPATGAARINLTLRRAR